MKLHNWLTVGGLTLGSIGAAAVVNSFMPRSFVTDAPYERKAYAYPSPTALPEIEISFLRCGAVTVPEWLVVRGSLSLAPRTIVYSAVLIKHPQGTFLYDTGLCEDLPLFVLDQSFFFTHTVGQFTLEKSICSHLDDLHMKPTDLDFILLSHLHWDHVAGIPDLPGVQLRLNRVEYDAASQGLFEKNHGLVRRLLCNNPVKLLDFKGPAYEGFRSSYDVFGDGSIILVPLPGHTAGQIGLFINRAHGARLFLLADAAWVADNYMGPTMMHPFIWSLVTSNTAIAKRTLVDLHYFSIAHPEVPMVSMHDGHMQDAVMVVEKERQKIRIV
jgi:N-acyl homoserine lactone hydrolase